MNTMTNHQFVYLISTNEIQQCIICPNYINSTIIISKHTGVREIISFQTYSNEMSNIVKRKTELLFFAKNNEIEITQKRMMLEPAPVQRMELISLGRFA